MLVHIFPAPGRGLRTALAALMMAEGAGYTLAGLSSRPLTTSYKIQVEYLPLHAFAVIFLLVGVALQITMLQRSLWWGRMIPVFGFAVVVFLASLYMLSPAYTAVLRFLAMAFLFLLELAHVEQGG